MRGPGERETEREERREGRRAVAKEGRGRGKIRNSKGGAIQQEGIKGRERRVREVQSPESGRGGERAEGEGRRWEVGGSQGGRWRMLELEGEGRVGASGAKERGRGTGVEGWGPERWRACGL